VTTVTRRTIIATALAAALTLVPALRSIAEEPLARPRNPTRSPWLPRCLQARCPAKAARRSPDLRLRAIVARAWDDSILTWKRLDQPEAVDISSVTLRFVAHLDPNNCYGFYAGDGPAYCSGNRTVFVGTGAATRLMAKFGPQGEAGITFLIGHEFGHHIQNIHGRFAALNALLARYPGQRIDLMRRFELEADCYAGVWMHASDAWANGPGLRDQVMVALAGIGDDSMLGRTAAAENSTLAVHGTSKQRIRWFLRGANGGDIEACNTFGAVGL
jgi:predicted metalloprotease